MGEVHDVECETVPIEYFPLSIVISMSKYDSVVGHSVVFLS